MNRFTELFWNIFLVCIGMVFNAQNIIKMLQFESNSKSNYGEFEALSWLEVRKKAHGSSSIITTIIIIND